MGEVFAPLGAVSGFMVLVGEFEDVEWSSGVGVSRGGLDGVFVVEGSGHGLCLCLV